MNTELLSPLLPNCSERPVPVFLSAAYRLQAAVPSDIEEQIEKLTVQPTPDPVSDLIRDEMGIQPRAKV